MVKKIFYISFLSLMFMACRKEVIVPNNLKEDGASRMSGHPCQVDVQPHNTDVSSKDLNNTSNNAKAMGSGNGNSGNTETTSSTSGDEGGITDPNDDEDEVGSALGQSSVNSTNGN